MQKHFAFVPMLALVLLPAARCDTAAAAAAPEVQAVTPPGTLKEARGPQVAVGNDGRVYVAYGAGNAVYCSVSNDRGRTYAAPVKVAEAGVLSLGMRRGPRIVVAGKTVTITAVYGRQGKGRDGDILAWHSRNGGKSWRGPARVNDVAGSAREGLHGMAAAPSGGAVTCVWLDLRSSGTTIYAASSRDGGATWAPNRLVYRSPDGTVCECCHPSAVYDAKGRLWVMWRNALGGARDMYQSRWDDARKGFTPAQKLGEGTWPLNACPMDGGALAAAPDGSVHTFWRRGGEMFTAQPGRPERRIGKGQQGWVAAGPGGAYLVWLAARPGALLASVPGRAAPARLAPGADDPVVAAAPGGKGPVVVVWKEGEGAAGGIRSAVLSPGASGR